MGFRVQSEQPMDMFDGMIAGAPCNATLLKIDALLDWSRLRALMAPAYDRSGEGKLGIDPVVLLKMLVLEELYALSDVQVSIEAADRLSFRRFLGLGAGDRAPDDTTLVRFRNRLREKGLLAAVHADIDAQLRAKQVAMKPGSITVIDATVIPAATRPPEAEPPSGHSPSGDLPKEASPPASDQASASSVGPRPKFRKRDREAAFGGKKGKLRFGFKMHAAIDAATGLVRGFQVTPANESDMNVFKPLLEGTRDGVLADKGYDSAKNRAALKEQNLTDGIMRRVGERRAKSLLGQLETARNRALSRLRSPAEGIFAILKRRRLGRAIYIGLQKTWEQVALAATVHNTIKTILWRDKCAC